MSQYIPEQGNARGVLCAPLSHVLCPATLNYQRGPAGGRCPRTIRTHIACLYSHFPQIGHLVAPQETSIQRAGGEWDGGGEKTAYWAQPTQ